MLLECHFDSWALQHAVNAYVILPTDHANPGQNTHMPKAKFPVLYLLHGGGGDASHWLRFTSIERYADERKIAVVMPTCVDMCYRNADITFPGMAWEGDKSEDYEAFFARELPDWAAANFPVSTAPADSFIAGFSLGGYGAAFHGFTNPDKYAALGLLSPYVFNTRIFDVAYRQSLTDAQLREELIPDLVEPVKAIAARGGQFPKVYMANGKRDVRELAPAYAALLREYGVDVTTEFDKYELAHEWAMSEEAIRDFLDWIPRTDSFCTTR